MKLFNASYIARRIANIIGVGNTPFAPGTAASFVAAAIWLALPLRACWQWIAAAVVALAGVWASGRCCRDSNEKDPAYIVIDEWAGMWFALSGLPKTIPVAGLALVFFRIFDIIKPPPIRQLERLPGGWGIVLDDIAAGLLARIVVGLITPYLVR